MTCTPRSRAASTRKRKLAFSSGAPPVISMILNLPRSAKAITSSIVLRSITSILCAPLLHGDSVFGLVYLDASGRPGAFDKDNLALLSAITTGGREEAYCETGSNCFTIRQLLGHLGGIRHREQVKMTVEKGPVLPAKARQVMSFS